MSDTILTVHHLNDSRSQRVLWLLEELQVPYEIKKYQRTPDMASPEELKAVHPLGTAPVITDGDVTLAESGAVIEYIIQKYGNGRARPPQSGEIHDLFFTHYTEGSLMPLIVNRHLLNIIASKAPFFIRPILGLLFSQVNSKILDPRLEAHARLIEDHLSKVGGEWFAGGQEPTAADYMMIFALETFLQLSPQMLGPLTKAYVQRVHERPAYKKGIEKGGAYAYA